MMSKAEVLKRLSALPTEELLHLLRDETIFELAAKYFAASGMNQEHAETETLASVDTSSVSVAAEPAKEAPVDRAKRPLNAFMAFRSYYLKLFPDVQQKTASGFLTTLWNKDPFRNKWALIAKVYSFVRDEIGRDKVSLSYFLGLSCPIMKIIEPSMYLAAFGWSVEEDETGSAKLQQSGTSMNVVQTNLQSEDFPNTENELLSSVISFGYFPDKSVTLMERMGSSSSGIMTTVTSTLSVPYTKQKLDFMKSIQRDPVQAARELLGAHCDEYVMEKCGVNSHNVEDLNAISHLPMEVEYPDPRRYYTYSTSHSYLLSQPGPSIPIDSLPEGETYDIDNPWDVDALLGYTQTEGERTFGMPPSPQYDSRNNFYYAF